ncbi:MAG: hypothetical protein V2I43_10480 [Parvularcula sp.]|jgi:hypothetical protein|nr:hypothetical protein [Parvularcula sp.]
MTYHTATRTEDCTDFGDLAAAATFEISAARVQDELWGHVWDTEARLTGLRLQVEQDSHHTLNRDEAAAMLGLKRLMAWENEVADEYRTELVEEMA